VVQVAVTETSAATRTTLQVIAYSIATPLGRPVVPEVQIR
jgi:hypothetical protein